MKESHCEVTFNETCVLSDFSNDLEINYIDWVSDSLSDGGCEPDKTIKWKCDNESDFENGLKVLHLLWRIIQIFWK